MIRRYYYLPFIVLILSSPAIAQENDGEQVFSELAKLDWQRGPTVGQIGSEATIVVPSGYLFLGSAGTYLFLELLGNLPEYNNYTLARDDLSWFSVFGYDDVGYIRDDDTIDPDALLKTIKENNAKSNEERKRRNIAPLYIEGWSVEPHYDLKTKRLEWGTRLRSPEGQGTVNYSIRLLGRTGVMAAILVSDTENLSTDLPSFKALLNGFEYNSGHRYSEFRQGDKVAQYGLAALIVGGAAAAAVKTGAAKGLFKFLAIAAFGALAVIGAVFKKIFSIFGRRSPNADD